MDIDVVIYGIIGALAILVCWLLDIYSSTKVEESVSIDSAEILRSEKSSLILPTCCFCHETRDDQGNWHDRSDYPADYQGVIGN